MPAIAPSGDLRGVPRTGHMTPVTAWIWFYCFAGFLGSLMWIKSLLAGYFKYIWAKQEDDGVATGAPGKAQSKKAD